MFRKILLVMLMLGLLAPAGLAPALNLPSQEDNSQGSSISIPLSQENDNLVVDLEVQVPKDLKVGSELEVKVYVTPGHKEATNTEIMLSSKNANAKVSKKLSKDISNKVANLKTELGVLKYNVVSSGKIEFNVDVKASKASYSYTETQTIPNPRDGKQTKVVSKTGNYALKLGTVKFMQTSDTACVPNPGDSKVSYCRDHFLNDGCGGFIMKKATVDCTEGGKLSCGTDDITCEETGVDKILPAEAKQHDKTLVEGVVKALGQATKTLKLSTLIQVLKAWFADQANQ